MGTYLIRRCLLMIPTMVGIVLLSFLVMKLAPGDPTAQKFGSVGATGAGMDAARGTESAIKQYRERMHLDDPLYVQFGYFLQRLATRDLIEFKSGQPIWDELLPALWVTILLNVIVIFVTYAVAVPLGIYSSAYPHTPADRLATVLLFMLYSLPSFWAADMLRHWTGDPAGWIHFPITGLRGEWKGLNWFERFLDFLHHIALPVFCMSYGLLAYLSRQMRAGMLEVIRQDYIRTAEAKGAGKARVILVHALRNGLFPIITLFATLLPFLIGGSVIIESIFNIPGMGRYAFNAVIEREYDAAMAVLILSAFLTLFGILISDILYVIVNPQISLEGRR